MKGIEEELGQITTNRKEKDMTGRCCFVVLVLALLYTGIAGAQEYPIMNMMADKVIQKYENASCQELWQKKGKPKSAREQEAVQLLRADPRMRKAFIDKVSPTIVNKMFECGMIP
jgi:hypothetical protein